jgi:hypothetical protein
MYMYMYMYNSMLGTYTCRWLGSEVHKIIEKPSGENGVITRAMSTELRNTDVT